MSKQSRRADKLTKALGEGNVRIEIYDTEGMAVIDHVFTQGGFVPKGHEDFAALRQMLTEMDLLLWFDSIKEGSITLQVNDNNQGWHDFVRMVPSSSPDNAVLFLTDNTYQVADGDAGFTYSAGGNVTITGGAMALASGSAVASVAGAGLFRYNEGTNKLEFANNGGAWTELGAGAGSVGEDEVAIGDGAGGLTSYASLTYSGTILQSSYYQANQGTASVCSYSIGGNVGYGIFPATAIAIGFALGGMERARLKPDGAFVLFDTAVPAGLAGGGAIAYDDSEIRFNANNTGWTVGIGDGFINGATSLSLRAGGTEEALVNSSGLGVTGIHSLGSSLTVYSGSFGSSSSASLQATSFLYSYSGGGSVNFTNSAGDMTASFNGNGTGNCIISGGPNDLRLSVASVSSWLDFVHNSTIRVSVKTEGLIIGNHPNLSGAGTNVLVMTDATAIPSATISGRGILYMENGALKFRGDSGTVTTIANA